LTSLLQAIADVGATARAEVEVDDVAVPASREAVRLALQLREVRSPEGGRTLLFVPASNTVDASMSARDAVHGLIELHEGPVLVMDLRASVRSGEADGWSVEGGSDTPGVGNAWAVAENSGTIVSRPFAGRRDTVPYAASGDFAKRLGDARASYSSVLCIGGPVTGSIETLIMASLFDGVVLSVAPGRTTRLEMHRATAQLRRAHAKVIGFVVDARMPKKGD
jgi:hypothetical protein